VTTLKINQPFYVGSWLVTPDQNKLKNSKKEIFIEPKLMHVLNYLCVNAPEAVSSDRLIEYCWPNQFFSDNPLHKCIAQLRKILGDKAKQPEIIKTISKKGYAIIALIKGINSHSYSVNTPWLGKNPYLGLNHYQKEHKDIYFGRNKAISEVKSLFNGIERSDKPLLILEGINGVGKTSLINCQIIPSLLEPTHPYRYTFIDSCYYDFKSRQDSQLLLHFINDLINMKVLEPGTVIEDFLNPPDHLSNEKNKKLFLKKTNSQNKVIFFIDHIEKIIPATNSNVKELELFFNVILYLITTGKYFFIFSIRSECYQNLIHSESFNSLEEKSLRYNLLKPDMFEITEIIQKPLLAAGLSYEFNTKTFESLDTTLINDAINIGDILSILSYTLKELCDNINKKHQLTFEVYNKIGGLKGALSYKVDTIINKLNQADKNTLNYMLYNLIQVDPNDHNSYVCVKVNTSTFKKDENLRVINLLLEEGLLQSEGCQNNIYVSIFHPSMIKKSNFFQKWIASNHLKLSLITEVRTLSNQWVSHQYDKNYLLKNKHLLEQINKLSNGETIKFDQNEKLFLSKSNQRLKFKNKLKFLLVSVLCSLLILTSLLLIENKKSNDHLITINNKAENLITFMLGDLKDTLRPDGKLDQIKLIGDQVIGYYNNRTKIKQSKFSTLQYYKALNIIGEVEVIRGELNSASDTFKLANKHDISYFKSNDIKLPALIHYSQSNYWLGYINFLQKKYNQTQIYWSKYLDLSQQLIEHQPVNEKWLLEKSYALNNLGTLNYKLKKYKTAKDYFYESAKIKKKLHDKNPDNINYIVGLADTISWQANIFDKENNLVLAKEMHHKSLKLTKKLSKIDSTKNLWQHRLALAYYRLALSHYQLGELKDTKFYLLQSIPIYSHLNKFDTTNQLWIKEFINNLILISKVYRHTNDIDNAILNLNSSLDFYNTYLPESKKLKYAAIQNLYINAEFSQVYLMLNQKKTALELFSKQAHNFDSTSYFNNNYYRAYINFILAKLYFANNKNMSAKLLLGESLKILNVGVSTTEDKRHMALYVAIERILKISKPTIALITKLKNISYQNPDFNY